MNADWAAILAAAAREAVPQAPELQPAGEAAAADGPCACLADAVGPVLWAQSDEPALGAALGDWLLACARALGLDGARPQPEQAPAGDAVGFRFAAGSGSAALWVAPRALGAPTPAAFPPLGETAAAGRAGSIDLLLDVPMVLTVELGRTERQIRDVLALAPGSIVELDRPAGEPVDLLVNGRLIARAEVVVVDENFGVRITDIVSPADRIERLGAGR
jgi:flagellar motor switch protein FliN